MINLQEELNKLEQQFKQTHDSLTPYAFSSKYRNDFLKSETERINKTPLTLKDRDAALAKIKTDMSKSVHPDVVTYDTQQSVLIGQFEKELKEHFVPSQMNEAQYNFLRGEAYETHYSELLSVINEMCLRAKKFIKLGSNT